MKPEERSQSLLIDAARVDQTQALNSRKTSTARYKHSVCTEQLAQELGKIDQQPIDAIEQVVSPPQIISGAQTPLVAA